MPVLEPHKLNRDCGHIICIECQDDGIEQANRSANPLARCPLCLPKGSLNTNGRLKNKGVNGASHDESYFQPQGHSSKMDALMADVRQDLESTKR
jgi:SWI/SNF-related matrix-associated actin-dependent regulator of chromatin subfamily A3